MTDFRQFAANCKMRHDLSDQIQVRYHHPDGQTFDTWVSGEEVLQRLETAAAKQRLKGLTRLSWAEIREARKKAPDEVKKRLRDRLQDQLGDRIEDALGDNPISSGLAGRVRGRDKDDDPYAAQKERWQTYLQDEAFRALVLELAWINLEGSLPDAPAAEPDDWI